MRQRRLPDSPNRAYVLRLERGEEVMGTLASFAASERILGAELSGIGAFERAVVGYYNFEDKDYDRLPVDDETEVLALLGNLSMMDEGPRVHLHATLSRRDGSALGGHLFEGHVGATVELFVREAGELRRTVDPDIGIPLLDLERAEERGA